MRSVVMSSVIVTLGLFKFSRFNTLNTSARSSSFVVAESGTASAARDPLVPVRPLNHPDRGVAAAVVRRGRERRGVEPPLLVALVEVDVAADVVRAAAAHQRVAGRRQILARLPADLAADLPAAQHGSDEVAPRPRRNGSSVGRTS